MFQIELYSACDFNSVKLPYKQLLKTLGKYAVLVACNEQSFIFHGFQMRFYFSLRALYNISIG